MIIACPACSTRYVVPDSAIGIEGRTVRCAKCKHSWFQEGPAGETAAEAPTRPRASVEPGITPPSPPPPPQADISATTSASPSTQARPERDREGPDFDEMTPPYGEVQEDLPPPPEPEKVETRSRFDRALPFRPRRNVLRMWTLAAAIFAVLAIGTVAAVSYAGLPEWMPVSKPLFGAAQPDLELEFPVDEQERRTLPNGTEFFGAKIIVSNTARETRPVPPILIVLRDQRERQVYSWIVQPPRSTLSPGEELTINEAVTDVPKSAVFADIGWAPN